MKTTCKECKGTGTLPGYHAEDDGRCCDDPVIFYCDRCQSEFEEEELEEVSEGTHFCKDCEE
jgi:uncharacterized Zn ribbon protein